MESVETDRLAMPVSIAAVDWYADEPAPDRAVCCRVRPTRLRSRDTEADLELTVDGQVLCVIRGWMDWRFEVDQRLWPVMQRTEDHLLAEPQDGGWVRFQDSGRSATATDYLLRRYCNERERLTYAELPENRRVRWLRGRIALKDAVRHLVEETYGERLFPVEIEVHHSDAGSPLVSLHGRDYPIYVSLTHKGDVSLAMAHPSASVGLDFETIESRDASFLRLAFDASELQLVGAVPSALREEWYMRLWCAKEAVSKALGTGLGGRPKGWVTTQIDGERVLCHGHWVETRRVDEGVVAWLALQSTTT